MRGIWYTSIVSAMSSPAYPGTAAHVAAEDLKNLTGLQEDAGDDRRTIAITVQDDPKVSVGLLGPNSEWSRCTVTPVTARSKETQEQICVLSTSQHCNPKPDDKVGNSDLPVKKIAYFGNYTQDPGLWFHDHAFGIFESQTRRNCGISISLMDPNIVNSYTIPFQVTQEGFGTGHHIQDPSRTSYLLAAQVTTQIDNKQEASMEFRGPDQNQSINSTGHVYIVDPRKGSSSIQHLIAGGDSGGPWFVPFVSNPDKPLLDHNDGALMGVTYGYYTDGRIVISGFNAPYLQYVEQQLGIEFQFVDSDGNTRWGLDGIPTGEKVNNKGHVVFDQTLYLQGQNLTANMNDEDSVNPKVESIDWYRKKSPGVWETLSERSNTYKLTNDDVGKQVRVVYTYRKHPGDQVVRTVTKTSEVVGDVEDIGSVELELTQEGLIQGSVITATVKDLDSGIKNVTYQWFRKSEGEELKYIQGANNNSYKVTQADVSNKMGVEVTYQDAESGVQSRTVRAKTAGVVKNIDDEGTVLISGEFQLGERLTSVITDPDGIKKGSVDYFWERYDAPTQTWSDFPDDPRFRQPDFEITADDTGCKLRLRVNYIDKPSGQSREVVSESTRIIPNVELDKKMLRLGGYMQKEFTTPELTAIGSMPLGASLLVGIGGYLLCARRRGGISSSTPTSVTRPQKIQPSVLGLLPGTSPSSEHSTDSPPLVLNDIKTKTEILTLTKHSPRMSSERFYEE